MTDFDETDAGEEQTSLPTARLQVIEGGKLRSTKRRGGKTESGEQDEPAKKSQAQILIELAEDVPLFLTADDEAHADIEIAGNRETVRLSSRPFKMWLRGKFYELTSGAPTPAAMQSAVETLAAKAWSERKRGSVFVRIGGDNEKTFIDLCNGSAAAVEVTADGWVVVNKPKVRFIRPPGLQPLPMPRRGGNIEELRPFINVKTDAQFILAVMWIVAALRNRGPYPVLILSGEQATAKSTFLRVLRDLIDPHVAPLRVLPKDDRELFISASNSHVLAFDNLSGMSAEMSDSLCRIATGGSISSRKLYSDGEEALFTAQKPICMNGIEDTATRGDLASRAIVIALEPIKEEDRKTEEEFYKAFEEAKPAIFGALLDLLSEGIRRLPTVSLTSTPRMADFAKFATAAETAHWPEGAFMEAYTENQGEATEAVLGSHPVAAAIIALVTEKGAWSGTAAALLSDLRERVGEAAKERRWPKDPTRMSVELKRLAPTLRRIGMHVEMGERFGKDRVRKIQLGAGSMASDDE